MFQLTLVVNESPLATNARSTDPGRFIMELPLEMMAHYEAASPSSVELCQLTAIQDLLCSLKSVLWSFQSHPFCEPDHANGALESQGSRVPHKYWHEKEQQLALNSLYQPVISELSPAALQLEALCSRRRGEEHFAHAHINQVILWAAESVKLYLPWSSVVMTVFNVDSLVSNNTVIFLQWMHSRHFFPSACLLPQHL